MVWIEDGIRLNIKCYLVYRLSVIIYAKNTYVDLLKRLEIIINVLILFLL